MSRFIGAQRMIKMIKYKEPIKKPSDLTGFAILFISTMKSLYENNKHHYKWCQDRFNVIVIRNFTFAFVPLWLERIYI